MNYGIPYMGSKNRIAKWVIDQLPSAEHFYDCFGGGGAISHCALLSGKYKYIHYNELDPLTFKAFKMAINGEFKNENRWISKEDFKRLKDTDPYASICFSFGNNRKQYLYSEQNENLKKALHYSIVFKDFSLLKDLNIDIEQIKNIEGRIPLLKKVKGLMNIKRLEVQNLENLNRLQSLESLERLQQLTTSNHIELTNLSYNELEFERDSVIYCDPPYINTMAYKVDFNHNDFYEWCRRQSNIYISEYTMPSDFVCIAQKQKTCCMSASSNKTTTLEKLFTFKKVIEV